MNEPLEYVSERENWNVYRLENGATIRAKLVVVRIGEDGVEPSGQPRYRVEHTVVVQCEPPRQKSESLTLKGATQ